MHMGFSVMRIASCTSPWGKKRAPRGAKAGMATATASRNDGLRGEQRTHDRARGALRGRESSSRLLRSRARNLQRPDDPGGEPLGGQPRRDGREAEERAVVAEEVDALDALRLLALAVARVRGAAVAADVRVAHALLLRGLEHAELGVGHAQAEGAVERVEDVADGDEGRGPARVRRRLDGDRPGEELADDGERGERGVRRGLTYQRVGDARRRVGQLGPRSLSGLGHVPKEGGPVRDGAREEGVDVDRVLRGDVHVRLGQGRRVEGGRWCRRTGRVGEGRVGERGRRGGGVDEVDVLAGHCEERQRVIDEVVVGRTRMRCERRGR